MRALNRYLEVLIVRTGLKGKVRNTPKVLVFISAQSHTSIVTLGKPLHISQLISLPINWEQWPHFPKEGDAMQWVAQSELEISGSYCILYGKSPGRTFHAAWDRLSLGRGGGVWGNGERGTWGVKRSSCWLPSHWGLPGEYGQKELV